MTLFQARQLFHQHVSPNGPDSPLVLSRMNEVCERFFTSGRWKGMTVEVDIAADEGVITLPRRCESILGVAVDKTPRTVFSRWYSFLPGGPGEVNQSAYSGPDLVIDAGDNHPTFRDSPYDTFYIRAKVPDGSDRNVGNYLLLKGFDASGNALHDADGAEGIQLNLAGAANTTGQIFTSLSSVVKPLTKGFVTLWAVDVATGAETQIGDYEPGEVNPEYRRYRVLKADNTEAAVVRALCKRRFVPLVSENDDVVPDNTGALKLGLMSLQYEDKNDLERATEYFTRALSLLNAELREQRGGQFNTLRFSPHGFGLGRVSRQY